MCSPIAAAGAQGALGVGQAVMGFIGGNEAAKANEQAANINYAQTRTTIAQQGVQLDQQKSENVEDTAIAAAQSQGKIANAAATSGLAPGSVMHSLNTAMFGIGRQASEEDLNDQNSREQLANEGTGAQISRQSQINKVLAPSALSLGVNIGDAGVAAYKTYAQTKG